MDYIRRTYNVPAKRGGRVRVQGCPGKITRAQYGRLWVLLDGDRRPILCHPTSCIEYL